MSYFLNFGRNLSQFSFSSAGSLASSLFIIKVYSWKEKGESTDLQPLKNAVLLE